MRPGHEQEVAGVGVGVQEAVVQDLLEVGVDEHQCGFLGHVAIGVTQGAGQVLALQPVEDQDAPGREVPVHAGDDDGVLTCEVQYEALHVLRLVAVVELFEHRLLQDVGDRREARHPRPEEPVQEQQDPPGVTHLPGHDVGHTGVLDLDGHGAPVVPRRPVHLGERGGRGRVGVEVEEGAVHRADVLLHYPAHSVRGRGGNPVLKARKLLHVRRREEVGPGRRELAQLEEPTPEVHSAAVEVLGPALVGSGHRGRATLRREAPRRRVPAGDGERRPVQLGPAGDLAAWKAPVGAGAVPLVRFRSGRGRGLLRGHGNAP